MLQYILLMIDCKVIQYFNQLLILSQCQPVIQKLYHSMGIQRILRKKHINVLLLPPKRKWIYNSKIAVKLRGGVLET